MPSLQRSQALVFIVVWAITGYSFVVAMTTTIGIDNTAVSATARALILVLSILLVVRSDRSPIDLSYVLFLVFWVFYLVRVFVSLHVVEDPTSRPRFDYWMWALGACFFPSLALFANQKLVVIGLADVRRYLCAVCITAIVILLFSGDTTYAGSDGVAVDIGRFNVSALNPISTGHLGVTGVLLGVALLVSGASLRKSMFAMLLIGLGFWLAVLANSRGPLVALTTSLLFLIAARVRSKTVVIIFAMIVLVGVGFVFGEIASSPSIAAMIDRFQRINTGEDLSVSIRITSFSGAWLQFLQSPIWGDAIEERLTLYYPHNVVLEALMATGVLGGLPFCILVVSSVFYSWRIVRSEKEWIWVGLISIQFVVGAMFSGAIWQSQEFWIPMVLSLVVGRELCLEEKRRIASFGSDGSSV